MFLRHLAFALFATAVCFLSGCNPNNSLSGAVTYNGEAVEAGSIAFMPAEGAGGPGFGAEIVDGKYVADKVSLGKHTATVRGVRKQLGPQTREEAMRKFEEAKAVGKATLDHYGQPADYIAADAEGNGQTIDVTGGAQTFDIAITGEPRVD